MSCNIFTGRPKVLYNNPCEVGTPLTDTITESPITCSLKVGDTDKCPPLYTCTKVFASKHSVCCPTPNVTGKYYKFLDQQIGYS